MELKYSHNRAVAHHTLMQMSQACGTIMQWNRKITSVQDYLSSPEGMEKMAASCMLIQSIGEGVKKIDRLLPDFFNDNAPDIPWRSIKGLRDHIAHGYFNIDADIVFDVAINEIPRLKGVFDILRAKLKNDPS